MTPEQISRNRAFLADLRANEKKAIGKMRDDEGGRCCLCVALDTACRLGFAPPSEWNDQEVYPPLAMARFYGWADRNPKLKAGNAISPAENFNDGREDMPELTHAEIADAFEATFPELKPNP